MSVTIVTLVTVVTHSDFKEDEMSLLIKESLLPHIPATAKAALAKMTPEEQTLFQSEFEKKKRSTGWMIFLSIFFPIQLLLLGKTGLWWVFILTLGGCGFWAIAEIFMTPRRTREYNSDIASKILTDMKIMNS